MPLHRRGKYKGPAGATHPPVAQLSAAAVSQVATHARTAKKMGVSLGAMPLDVGRSVEGSEASYNRLIYNNRFNQCD